MRYVGPTLAFGFVIISAASNFLFAVNLARSPALATVYGCVGVLATLANAYVPIRMLDAWDHRRYPILVAGAALLIPCIAFSVASAFGFAATVRDRGTSDQAALSANYQTTLQQLKDEEAKPKKDPKRVDALREKIKTYREKGALKSGDHQASSLEALGIPDGRFVLNLLFALLVEIGSAVGMFFVFAEMKPVSTANVAWKPKSS